MWPYWGWKWGNIAAYPAPLYPSIFDPFGGSGSYSLYYWRRDIWINDSNSVIYGIWKWLQSARPRDIFSLPRPRRGQDIHRLLGPGPWRDYLGFVIKWGDTRPCRICCATPREIDRRLAHTADSLHKIQHWKITNDHWEDLVYETVHGPDRTTFIDAPYQYGSQGAYPDNDIDFDWLRAWCLKLPGQAIACEDEQADWLPSRQVPLARQPRPRYFMGGRVSNTHLECIWTRGC